MSRLCSVRLEIAKGFHVLEPQSQRTDRRKTSGRELPGENADGDADRNENQTEPSTAGQRALDGEDRWPARFTVKGKKEMKT